MRIDATNPRSSRPASPQDVIRRFWQDQFLAGYHTHDTGGDDPTIGIDYEGRVFQILGGLPGTPAGIGCWGTNTTTGYVQVNPNPRSQSITQLEHGQAMLWGTEPWSAASDPCGVGCTS